jgi:FkbM family methyltransferase
MKKLARQILTAVFGDAAASLITQEFSIRCKNIKGGYFGLGDLDRKLEKFIDYDNGFFVELGANDGVKQSNTYHFELKRGWCGVLVEPSPHNYLACLRRRGKKNSVFCNACVSFQYDKQYVDMVYADLMTVSENLDSDLGDMVHHLVSAEKFLARGESVFGFGAVAKPLSALLDLADAPSEIDLLSLDVEGAELEVLKGIDFGKYKFKYMLIECRDLDRLSEFLDQFGYKIEAQLGDHDYLFKIV